MSEQPTAKIRLLIVDDHPLFREGLGQMVSHEPDLVVCGEVAAAEALRVIPNLKPDLLLMEISLGGTSGLDLIKAIKNAYDDLPVLVISMHDESLYAERSLRAGAMGYVMKHETGKTVRNAIRKVLGGEMYLSEKMSSAIIAKVMHGQGDPPASMVEILSDRELQVFRMLGQGKGVRLIAQELEVAIPTVNSFRNRIKQKLRLKTATEVILHSIQCFQGEIANRGEVKKL
jgi:DNA-binding NarL/FixJ family response regulator